MRQYGLRPFADFEPLVEMALAAEGAMPDTLRLLEQTDLYAIIIFAQVTNMLKSTRHDSVPHHVALATLFNPDSPNPHAS